MFRKCLQTLLICACALTSSVVAQRNYENFLFTASKTTLKSRGDAFYRSVYYVAVPPTVRGDLYLRVFDADMGGNFDLGVDTGRTSYRVFGKNGITWGLRSIEEETKESNTLFKLELEDDEAYNNQWRTLCQFSPANGESRDSMIYFQVVVDGVAGQGINAYRLFVSTSSKENIGGIRMFTYMLPFQFHESNEFSTEVRFRVPGNARNLTVYNFDVDKWGTISFESDERDTGIPITASGEGVEASTVVTLLDAERGKLSSLVFRDNANADEKQVEIWIKDDQGKDVPIDLPTRIAPRNRLVTTNFKFAPLSECNSMTLEAITTDPDKNDLYFEWSLPNGVEVQGSKINYNFLTPGKYPVTLTVAENSGYIANKVRVTKEVWVNDPPVPRFVTVTKGSPFQLLKFDASSSSDADGKILSYSWNFGDGTKGEGVNVSHLYSTPGNYAVELSIIDDGLSLCKKQQTSQNIFINTRPKAVLNAPIAGSIGETINVDALKSTDIDGKITSYKWDFGDGNSASGEETGHAYDKPGTFAIRLIVEDDAGTPNSTDEAKAVIVINAAPVANFIYKEIVAAGEIVVFNASRSVDPDGQIISYKWDFGDGTDANDAVLNHSYATPGEYTVTLQVTDNSKTTSSSSTVTHKIRVNSPPIADAGGDQKSNPGELHFDAGRSKDTDDEIIDYFWDFGGVSTARGVKVSTVFQTPGVYPVTLTIIDGSGTRSARQENKITVVINQKPRAEAGRMKYAGIAQAVEFDGQLSSDVDGQIVSYEWEFGDGSAAIGSKVEHSFVKPGVYQVRLKVKDDAGAEGFDFSVIQINPLPQILLAN